VRPRLLAEATLLPWLAPQLPLPVPVPELTDNGVRHLMLPGSPFTDGGTAIGRELGAFLKALHGVDPARVVLRWHVQHEIVVIPKSKTDARIRTNFDISDFELTDEEMAAIDGLARR